jgi:hypothetical protein
LYLAHCHWTFPGIVTWLAADDVAGAREQMQRARGQTTPSEFHIGHLWNMISDRQVDLYAGDGSGAYARITAQWPRLRSMARIQLLRIEGAFVRGRAALAAVPRGDVRALVAAALADARRIEREQMAWATALATLLRACAAAAEGQRDPARTLLSAAIGGFDAAEMPLFAASARYRLGQLVGGDEGSALTAAALAWMSQEKIRQPARMIAMLAPGFAD